MSPLDLVPPYNRMMEQYDLDGAFDEMFSEAGEPRPQYSELLKAFLAMPPEEREMRKRSADLSFLTEIKPISLKGAINEN